MNKPSKEDVAEFTKMGENVPKTVAISKEQQDEILKEIANSDIDFSQIAPARELKDVEGTEVCPHCDTEFDFVVKENVYTAICPNCGKTIPLCDKCDRSENTDCTDCTDCIFCDLANFRNYLRGNISIEKFLGSMNPPLTDMTTCDNPLFTPTYEGFLSEDGGDSVTWDMKYWEIYGKIDNAMFAESSQDEDILSFLKEIIEDNRK